LIYQFENYLLDVSRRELRRAGHLVPLEPRVFDLLEYLIRNRDRAVSKDDLIAGVWNGRIVSDSAVSSRMNAVRSVISDAGDQQRSIRTISRKGFRFVAVVREVPDSASALAAILAPAGDTKPAPVTETVGPAIPDTPSIAVLPFTNMSGDTAQQYFADGIVEDITTELSRFNELFVIARNSSFKYRGKAIDVRQIGRDLGVRYLLEGSVRRMGDGMRVTVQLIDALTGRHRWAERYDRKIEDVFAVQDEVVRSIVTILAAHVKEAETERTLTKPPTSWHAYDYYLQATDRFSAFIASLRVDELYETRRLLQRSIALDPNYARAYALLSTTYTTAWVNPWDGDYLNADILEWANELARKGVELDPGSPQARACLGLVLMWKRRHEQAIAEFERAISLNPNYVDWRFGLALVYAGEAERAIQVLHAYRRLDPFYAPTTAGFLGLAFFTLRQYSQALPLLRETVSRAPKLRAAHTWLAATLGQLGQLDEARAAAAEVLRITPDWTINGIARRLAVFKNSHDAEHYFEGLRKAGLPED